MLKRKTRKSLKKQITNNMKIFKIISLIIFGICNYQYINGQNINGIYQSDFTLFENPNDKSLNFSRPSEDVVIIDITEFSEVKGTFILQSKDENNETYGLKFNVYGTKTIKYEQEYTHYSYNAKLYILDEEVRNQNFLISYSFSSENRYFMINFPGGSQQIWIINKKI